MVTLRPHIAKVTIPGGDSVFNQETGDYETLPEVLIEFPCRVSPNGGGQKVKNQDGADVVYSYLVHADILVPFISYGSTIEVYKGLELKAKSKVIGSFSNSMNTRIWL